jgi:hypothetical protein
MKNGLIKLDNIYIRIYIILKEIYKESLIFITFKPSFDVV